MKTVEELRKTNDAHKDFCSAWCFFGSVYDGITSMVADGVIAKHERESNDNFISRSNEAYCFGYCKSVVDIFNFYLHEKGNKNDYGELEKDELFTMFMDDCDLYGNSWEQFIRDQQRNASIYGHVGLLVDKGKAKIENRKQEIDLGLYPYVAAFSPQNILDWEYERDPNTARPELIMVKLLEETGTYIIWERDKWERYEIVKVEDKPTEEVRLVDSGTNPLGEVPFVWLYNVKHRERKNVGVSDLGFIGYVEASIVRNMSHGEEVIKYGAFPVKRAPKKHRISEEDGDDDIGAGAIWEFDPGSPESKPDWLQSAVAEPIGAIVSWIGLKVAEIYRASNTGGVSQSEVNAQAKSGDALKREFQMLNSILISKADNEIEAAESVMYFWSKWQNVVEKYDKISMNRCTDYSIANLETELANALSAKTIVTSETFLKEVKKKIARLMMPELPEETQVIIDEEIDSYEPPDMSALMGGMAGEEETDNTGAPAGGNVVPIKGAAPTGASGGDNKVEEKPGAKAKE